MRRAARVDANQRQIAETLKRVGASVEYLHTLGAGVPDLLVGFRGRTYLLEIKDGDKSPSKRALTRAQQHFHANWQGRPVSVVTCEDEALQAIGLDVVGVA